ncbi:MAG: hypothetical protein H0X04_00345 [Chthoniobacterales bacterium]|nr:hypothetical protein [Chthoniobacterales bacterium]
MSYKVCRPFGHVVPGPPEHHRIDFSGDEILSTMASLVLFGDDGLDLLIQEGYLRPVLEDDRPPKT